MSEAVADENASAIKEEQSEDPIGDYQKWKSTLNQKNRRILELEVRDAELVFSSKRGQHTEEVNRKFNDDLDRQIAGTRIISKRFA